MIPTLGSDLWFPDPRGAIASGPMAGLVAVGGDLSPARLLQAYRSGIFPWSVDPVSWWSPDPRAIFELEAFHAPGSLQKLLRKGRFQITRNTAFDAVIRACAAPRKYCEQTWISPEFIAAYSELHRLGHAHSFECWLEGTLAGGIYGVAIGGFFSGESMFHAVSNASKVALFFLIEHLRARDFLLFDIQMLTPVTRQLGAITIPRTEFLRRLASAVTAPVTF